MHCHCLGLYLQKENTNVQIMQAEISESSEGEFTDSGLEGSEWLLSDVAGQLRSHQGLLKIQSGPTQNRCYFNTPMVSARCKLLCFEEWRWLRQVTSFVEQGRRSEVKETPQEQAGSWRGVFPSGSQTWQPKLQTETIIARIQGNVSRVKATTDYKQFPERLRGWFTPVSTSISWWLSKM